MALLAQLQERLQRLDALLERLSPADTTVCSSPSGARSADAGAGAAPPVSERELAEARSQTGLSARINARLLREQRDAACRDGPGPPASSRPPAAHTTPSPSAVGAPSCASAAAAVFDKSELIEHVLSFLTTPSELAGAGAICTSWYLASRLCTLWARLLRASGRLGDPSSEALDSLLLPYEEEYTLFETVGRIHSHGCRPLDTATGATPPVAGTIDRCVDDLAAYHISDQISDVGATHPLQPPGDAPSSASIPRGGAGAVYLATHATRGDVVIRSLCASSSGLVCASMSGTRHPMPLPTSPHLQPVLQAICCEGKPAHVFLVQPVFESTLERRLKTAPLSYARAHRIFCQLLHAVAALHEQGYAHGAILLPNVVLTAHERMPFARLDQIYAARRVVRPGDLSSLGRALGWRGRAGVSDLPSSIMPSPVGGAGGAAAMAAAAAGEVADGAAAADSELSSPDADARFNDILGRAWSSYDRLGTVLSAHADYEVPGDVESQDWMGQDWAARERAAIRAAMAPDVSDLGRLLMRMLLQPLKMRAANHFPPHGPPHFPPGHPLHVPALHPPHPHLPAHPHHPLLADHGAAPAEPRPPHFSSFEPSLRALLSSMLFPNSRTRPTAAELLRHPWVVGLPVAGAGWPSGVGDEPHPPPSLPGAEAPRAPLCCCWKLVQTVSASQAAPSDLRLLRRPQPPFQQVCPAGYI